MRPLLIPAAIIGTFVSTREVLKTQEDVTGDDAVGKVTVTTRWGRRGRRMGEPAPDLKLKLLVNR